MKNRRKSDTHAAAVPQTASVSKEEVSTAVTRNPNREEQFATKADLKRTEKYLVKMVKTSNFVPFATNGPDGSWLQSENG